MDLSRRIVRGLELLTLTLALGAPLAGAEPARVLLQPRHLHIIRLAADDQGVVWQEAGNKLYYLNLQTRQNGEIEVGKRVFAPAISGRYAVFAAGDIIRDVDVYLFDFKTRHVRQLDHDIPWIIEPGVSLGETRNGSPRLRAVWEHAENSDGDALSIVMLEYFIGGTSRITSLVSGPVLTRDETPAEFAGGVHHEYPKIDGDQVVYVTNENGPSSVYRYDIKTGRSIQLAPSPEYQQRPDLSGPYTVWEQSEAGYDKSDKSDVYVHDLRTGEVKKMNAEPGFHEWAKVRGNYAVYTAKREPAPRLLSVRVYDIERGVELPAQRCFPGKITDYGLTSTGVIAAQDFPEGSRLLFATFAQIAQGCQ